MKPFFQAGVCVPDLDAAMAELGAALDLRWGTPVEVTSQYGPMRVVFSLDGPPWIEVIEGPPGSPWDASAGPRLDHIGLWSDDYPADRTRLVEQGLTLEVDGPSIGGRDYGYFRSPATGMRIELLDQSMQDAFYPRWGIERPAET